MAGTRMAAASHWVPVAQVQQLSSVDWEAVLIPSWGCMLLGSRRETDLEPVVAAEPELIRFVAQQVGLPAAEFESAGLGPAALPEEPDRPVELEPVGIQVIPWALLQLRRVALDLEVAVRLTADLETSNLEVGQQMGRSGLPLVAVEVEGRRMDLEAVAQAPAAENR